MLVPKKQKPQKTAAETPLPIHFDVEKYRVDLAQTITQTVCISIQQKTILTLGSLLVLTGKPKARKTTFLHAFLASAMLNDSIWTIRVSLPDDRPEVCLIDTEQSIFDLINSLKRIEPIIGKNISEIKNFSVYSARSFDVLQITQLIESICEKNPKIGLIALDGLIDLVNDINDVRESKSAITFIKKVCDKFNVAIIGIIHQNKGTNYSLGHLGAFASRFAQSELSIEKNDDDNTSTMKSTYLRSADDISPIQIGFDESRNVYDEIKNINYKPKQNEREILEKIFAGKVGLTYKDLCTNALLELNCSRYEIEKKLIPVWYANNLIQKVGNLIQLTRVF